MAVAAAVSQTIDLSPEIMTVVAEENAIKMVTEAGTETEMMTVAVTETGIMTEAETEIEIMTAAVTTRDLSQDSKQRHLAVERPAVVKRATTSTWGHSY